MSARRLLSVVGTRPNFMKMAPVIAELRRRADRFEHVLVHTGQHYDDVMSDVFLSELGVGAPDHLLSVGSGSHAAQTARVMERLEPVLVDVAPDVILVPGDVNSTLAAAIVAAKLGIPVGHVEAGLRSFDRSMPEELNRIVADALSDLLFIHSPEARDNLMREGAPDDAIHYVGNTMIDSLVAMRGRLAGDAAARTHGVEPGRYLVVTLHRPALVDGAMLAVTMEALGAVSTRLPVVFPVHPRTRAALAEQDWNDGTGRLHLIEPLGYVEFLSLVSCAAGVLTDSGGIQEETTYLGIPCFTLRNNTERPATIVMGTNRLLGLSPERIAEIPELIEATDGAAPAGPPPRWDGKAAVRLANVLAEAPLAEMRGGAARAVAGTDGAARRAHEPARVHAGPLRESL